MRVAAEEVRFFRMGALAAVIGLKQYLEQHDDALPTEAAVALKRTDADYAGADFESGLELLQQLPKEIDFRKFSLAIRDILSFLIESRRPWWLRLFPLGRQLLANSLTKDELQTFRIAGLMDVPPTPDVLKWWDYFASRARQNANETNLERGRDGELLTLEYERKRLARLGIHEEPKWIAIEDNTAGYDVLSYDKSEYGLVNKLIEVKATTDAAPRMILTRNEWKHASQLEEAYCFHIWALPSQKLEILSVKDVSMHVPSDIGSGNWLEVEIKF